MSPVAGRHLAADQAFARAAGAPLVDGNAVRVLRDGAANYPAWLDAIAAATSFIHFDSYIVHDDRTGNLFADALIARARAGVTVRVVYDWVGALRASPRAFWYRLEDAGVQVRAFNPPAPWRPLAWLARDHRKMLAVDGRVAYVSGLCVGDDWIDTPGRPAWRDTGVEITGPAVADVHDAFAEVWLATGGAPLPEAERPTRAALARRGGVALRVIGSTPATAAMLRLDALVAGLARERLWITDAYFVGLPSYVQALTAAAADGVDVRLLVPGASDLPVVRSLTRAGYRGLLAGGVRVFEWNGPMVHAKTAVADGQWARVGSTNLNLQSWMGNWELDVAVEDAGVATALERLFEQDLTTATEVVLDPRRRVTPARDGPRRPAGAMAGRKRGRPSRAAAGALRLGHTVGAALAATRPLGAAEAPTLAGGGLLLLLLAALALWRPTWLAYPIGVAAVWLGLSLPASAVRTSGDGQG
ncbi:MAG: phospholipase D-like domain-containing protein [Vicinamibacterales bacterium]